MAWLGAARHGSAQLIGARPSRARRSAVWPGMARFHFQRQVEAWLGEAMRGFAEHGMARQGKVQLSQGMAGHGSAVPGMAWQGVSGLSKARLLTLTQ